jgi:tetratricopeptide (TPR) repeat protein
MNCKMKRILSVGIFILSALMLNAQDAADKIKQAQEAMTAQDYAKAFELYDSAMKNLGDVQIDATVNFNIGYAAFRADKFKEAIVYFDKAIEVGANVGKSWEYKANSYNKLEDYANAVSSFEKAAGLTEQGGDALIYNGAIAAYKGDMFDKAVELFAKSVELGYKGETAQYYKAIVLKKQKKDDEYVKALVEGVEKFPGNKKLGEALAKEYVIDGNTIYQKGVAILNAANQKVNAGTLKTTDSGYSAEVEKAKAEFKAAAEILQKATSLDATNENASKLLDACKQNLSI